MQSMKLFADRCELLYSAEVLLIANVTDGQSRHSQFSRMPHIELHAVLHAVKTVTYITTSLKLFTDRVVSRPWMSVQSRAAPQI